LFNSSQDDRENCGAVRTDDPFEPDFIKTFTAEGNKIMAATIVMRGAVSGLENKDFEKLAVPLLDGLYNFACWLSGDPDEARDLVQETFVKSLKGFSSFREGTNFRAWMFRILRNTFLTSRTGLERRNTQQEDEIGFDESVVTMETPEVALIRRANTNLVQAAIAQLAPAFQEVVLLADVEEMKYQEVAEALDIPIGTVMSRLARARKQIRGHIVAALGEKRIVGAK
jgi:RNA polymerase sigma-70 factor (ECF subfamily)